MKKIYTSILLLMLLFIDNINSQNNCSAPYPFTSSTGISYTATTGVANTDTTNNYGCLASTMNPHWLYLGICNSGPIDITITSASASSSMDVDFVIWGPLMSPTDCGLDSSQIIDCSFSTASTEYINIPSAISGEYYKILISNFSNISGTVTLTQSSGFGTACDSTILACSGIPVFSQAICKVSNNPSTNHNLIFWDKNPLFTGFYNIQKETTTMGVYSTMASVAASDTSVYEDIMSNPMIQSFKYKIETADTCGNINNTSIPHQTIHLQTSINASTGFPQLSWNPYAGFSYGTYYILRGTSATTLVSYDSISASSLSYTDVNPLSGINYYAVSVIPPLPCQPSRSMSNYSLSNVSPVLFTNITENNLDGIIMNPNPAVNEILISFGNTQIVNGTIELLDITGRLLIKEFVKNENSKRLDLSTIGNGYYLIKVNTRESSIQKRIIVSK